MEARLAPLSTTNPRRGLKNVSEGEGCGQALAQDNSEGLTSAGENVRYCWLLLSDLSYDRSAQQQIVSTDIRSCARLRFLLHEGTQIRVRCAALEMAGGAPCPLASA